MPAPAVALAGAALRNPRRTGRLLLALAAALGIWVLFLIGVLGSILGVQPLQESSGPSPAALADIPGEYLELYQQAGAQYGVDPWILAAIGKVETNHGRSTLPGVRPPLTNTYGCCAGPMQMCVIDGCPGTGSRSLTVARAQAGTWRGVGVDGNRDGQRDPWDPADAIPAAARLLVGAGAPADYSRAIFAYNHAGWYVADVLAQAAVYRGAARTAAATAAPILSVGDSLAEGTSAPLQALRATLTTSASIGRTSTEGLAELQAASELPSTLLVQLGTNDTSVREFRSNVRAIKALAGVDAIYWVNISRPPLGGTTDVELNAVLEAEADGKLRIIDWKAAVRSGRAQLASDRIHATPAGYRARAQLIHQALPLTAAGTVGSASAAEVLANRRIVLTAGQRADLARPGMDGRLLATLKWIGERHSIIVTALRADHYPGTNHEAGRAIDIGSVDGEICRGGRTGVCADLVRELAAVQGPTRSTELIYCWDPDPADPGMFARADHCDHIHWGMDA